MPLLASSILNPETDPPKERNVVLEKNLDASSSKEKSLDLDRYLELSTSNQEEYAQFQFRIFRSTLLVTVIVIALSAIFLGKTFTISLFVGSLSGILYLRLLARSIGKLGAGTKSVGKTQLLIPVFLVLLSSRFSQLELLPALLGFLLYKPSLIFQMLLES